MEDDEAVKCLALLLFLLIFLAFLSSRWTDWVGYAVMTK